MTDHRYFWNTSEPKLDHMSEQTSEYTPGLMQEHMSETDAHTNSQNMSELRLHGKTNVRTHAKGLQNTFKPFPIPHWMNIVRTCLQCFLGPCIPCTCHAAFSCPVFFQIALKMGSFDKVILGSCSVAVFGTVRFFVV